MVRSTPESGRATSQRRSPKKTASARPRTSSRTEGHQSSDALWWATGPSTICFSTSGITSPASEAISAQRVDPARYQRIGRA